MLLFENYCVDTSDDNKNGKYLLMIFSPFFALFPIPLIEPSNVIGAQEFLKEIAASFRPI